ncbi:MAG TPA: methylenetetrahydrofolate reductase [Mycobacteriales bacterium]|nr:methylenetetrahydrofolate reductase [Mycobacteriales bacterium]
MTGWLEPSDNLKVLCELEPATRPDLRHVRRQVALLDGVTDAYLVPDNHLGRATVSSIAVAGEVAALGGSSVACLNSRDRNLLGFRRDLLTAAAYGVDSFLFVRGDEPSEGTRSTDLTVRRMLDDAREFAGAPFRIGATARVGSPIPAWKQAADFLLVQMSFDVPALVKWRRNLEYSGPVFAGVLVLASTKMARNIASTAKDVSIPEGLIAALEEDRDAGVDFALNMVEEIRASKAMEGVHLVPVTRIVQVADRLRLRHEA